jgi:hypothetical protein
MASNAVLLAVQANLIRREEVAEATMAFHFEKPSGFNFKAGQYADVTLSDPPEAGTEGNPRSFSIASPPFENQLVFTTRMRDTAFKRSLKKAPSRYTRIRPSQPCSSQAESGLLPFSASCGRRIETASRTVYAKTRPPCFLMMDRFAQPRFAQPRFERSDYDFSSGEPTGDREHTD